MMKLTFKMINALILSLVLLFVELIHTLDNGLALTPPMGWNSWERFRCTTDCVRSPTECISEWLIKRTADLLVSSGYLAAGYEYVVIDDCWLAFTRDRDGNLRENSTRFPSGILDLSRYVHSIGLKFGIYGNYGTKTCSGYPGIIDDLCKDAFQFAKWEVDFVKLDGCYSEIHEKEVGYPAFGRYLNDTGRPIVYSCSWPAYLTEINILPDFEALKKYCNLWRNFIDVEDSWLSVCEIMDYFGDKQDLIAREAGPGHWNDPDMLIVGNFGLSLDQARVQMAIWSLLAAPLFLSTDLATIRPEFESILLNKDIIEIDQDKLGIQGRRIYKKKSIEIWRRPILPSELGYHSYAIAFVSRRIDGVPYYVSRTLSDLGLYNPKGYVIKDLYCGIEKVITAGSIRVKINPTGVIFLKFTVIPDDNDAQMKRDLINNSQDLGKCNDQAFFIYNDD